MQPTSRSHHLTKASELWRSGALPDGSQLKWRAWMQLRVDWDHDHCEFCGAKFGPAELAPTL